MASMTPREEHTPHPPLGCGALATDAERMACSDDGRATADVADSVAANEVSAVLLQDAPGDTMAQELIVMAGDAPQYSSEEDGPQAAQPPSPRPTRQQIEERLCLPLETPLIQGRPRLRRSKTLAPQSLRRSSRIAATPRENNCTSQAQAVLLKKLGEAPTSTAIGCDTVALCKKAFQGPLSDDCHDNLQKLLGMRFDPVAFNLNMLGLEDEPNRLC